MRGPAAALAGGCASATLWLWSRATLLSRLAYLMCLPAPGSRLRPAWEDYLQGIRVGGAGLGQLPARGSSVAAICKERVSPFARGGGEWHWQERVGHKLEDPLWGGTCSRHPLLAPLTGYTGFVEDKWVAVGNEGI